jgi:hypothetical protein
MNLFVEKRVFNSSLNGKAVRIKGYDVDGEKCDRLFLVSEVDGEYLDLINSYGSRVRVHMESFEGYEECLKLTILEEK